MKKIKIKVTIQNNNLLKYLIENNIEYEELVKFDDSYTLIIKKENYKKISRRFNTKIIRYYGYEFYKKSIIKNKYLIISYIISLMFLNILQNTIFDIEINCKDKKINSQIIEVLNKNEIKVNKKIKSFKELEIIKDQIKKEIEEVEWLEITRNGTKYIIDITLKKSKNKTEESKKTNIIASRDGVIKHIVVYNGEKIKDENEYVKKGEIIITGEIYKDENLVDNVEAQGEVYAEVWYILKITVPLEYMEKIETNKRINHYYIKFQNRKMTLLGKYSKEDKITETNVILDKAYLPFKIYKDTIKKINETRKMLTEKEALDMGVELSEKKIKNDLNNGEYIISKNILKKELKSSKMYIEVFYKLYENIASIS